MSNLVAMDTNDPDTICQQMESEEQTVSKKPLSGNVQNTSESKSSSQKNSFPDKQNKKKVELEKEKNTLSWLNQSEKSPQASKKSLVSAKVTKSPVSAPEVSSLSSTVKRAVATTTTITIVTPSMVKLVTSNLNKASASGESSLNSSLKRSTPTSAITIVTPSMTKLVTSTGFPPSKVPEHAPNFLRLATIQNMTGVQQAIMFPPRMNIPNAGISNLGLLTNLHNVSQLPVNPLHLNTMHLGLQKTPANLALLGMQQNRMNVPQMLMQSQRMNLPPLNMQVSHTKMPQLSMMQNVQSTPRMGLQSQTTNEQKQIQQLQQQQKLQQQQIIQLQQQQLQQQHLQQQQVLNAQLNILKNTGVQSSKTNTGMLGIRPPGINVPPMNILPNMGIPHVGMQGKLRYDSHLAMQRQLAALAFQQALAKTQLTKQQNSLNFVQQNKMSKNRSGSSVPTSISQISSNNSSQVAHRPPLRMPLMPNNTFQLGVNDLNNISQLRMPQLSGFVQPFSGNMSQVNVPQRNTNLTHRNILTSNASQANVQQVSSISRMNVPSRGTNIPQGLRNVSKSCLQQQATNISQLGIPQLEEKPQPPGIAADFSPFRVPLFARNVMQSGLNLPQPGMTNKSPMHAPKTTSSGSQLNLSSGGANAPQISQSLPPVGAPQLFTNMRRFGVPQPGANIPPSSMPQTPGNLADFGLQDPNIGSSNFDLQQQTQMLLNQQLVRTNWFGNQHTGAQRRVTGVTRQLSGVVRQSVTTSSVSQQSASVSQPVEGQKCIISHSENGSLKEKRKPTRAVVLKHIQRKRVKHQIALLNLLKRYERYQVRKLVHRSYGKKGMLRKHLSSRCNIAESKKLQLVGTSKAR